MNCKTAQRQMALAVGDDLSPPECGELQDHLQACVNCQKTWTQQQHSFMVLQRSRSHERPLKSDSVWPVLVDRLRERESDAPRAEFNGWFAGLAMTAACVLIFVFSQDGPIPMASQPRSGSVSDSILVSSPLGRDSLPPSIPNKMMSGPSSPTVPLRGRD